MEEACGAPGDALGMVDRPVWLDKAQARKPSTKRPDGQAFQEDNREPWKVTEWGQAIMEEASKTLDPAMCP